jgi:hypothetical protein
MGLYAFLQHNIDPVWELYGNITHKFNGFMGFYGILQIIILFLRILWVVYGKRGGRYKRPIKTHKQK